MEDDLPRPSGDAATRLSYESLDPYSQDELIERIALLEAEIARVKAHHARAADRRKLADSLFGAGGGAGSDSGGGSGSDSGGGPGGGPGGGQGDGG